MRTQLLCIPCFFKQLLQTGEIAGLPEIEIKRLMDKLGEELQDYPLDGIPPHIGKRVQELIFNASGIPDPYRQIKQQSNLRALSVYPELKKMAEQADDPLYTAVQLACAGNIIDYGVFASSDIDVSQEVSRILELEQDILRKERPELFDFKAFAQSLKEADEVVYVGDNAGEIVFDRILIETISQIYPSKRLTFIVRGSPVLNDCLEEDAYSCKLDRSAEIISSGVASAGLIIEDATDTCRDRLFQADLIISKGQGNYESLSSLQAPIFFLLTAKCKVIADVFGCEIGDLILKEHHN